MNEIFELFSASHQLIEWMNDIESNRQESYQHDPECEMWKHEYLEF